MKILRPLVVTAVLVFGAAVQFSGCVPSTSTETNNITLIANPNTIALTKATDKIGSSIQLSCGCNFGPVDVQAYTGDTAMIHYISNNLDSVISAHAIFFSTAPAAKSGTTYRTTMALHHFDDHKNNLYDTIHVTALLP